MVAATMKRTPLHAIHARLGAKLVPFGGYEMPVSYAAGITAEHRAVREAVGVFDVSHMGEFEVTGPDRNAFVQRITCNDVGALRPGQAQYTALLTERGTFLDDCVVYRFDDRVMIVVNAANIEKDWEHVVARKRGANVRLKNVSDETGLLAVRQRHRRYGHPLRGGPRLDREAREGRGLRGARRLEAAAAGGRAAPARRVPRERAEERGPTRLRSVSRRPPGGRGAQRHRYPHHQRRHRHDLPAAAAGAAGRPVRDRRAGQARGGGGGEAAVRAA